MVIVNQGARLWTVYGIECLRTNGRYVGKTSKAVQQRITEHVRDLRAGKHHSRLMQRDFDELGEGAFVATVLHQTMSGADATRLERVFINDIVRAKGVRVYNTSHTDPLTRDYDLTKPVVRMRERPRPEW